MQRRTTLWFLLLFQPLLAVSQNETTDGYECQIGAVNPTASSSGNACFKLYDTPKSYQDARSHCVSLGGRLADRINRDDSSIYSANADLEAGNATQFWVGASNLKCNVAWEDGGEIEFNELWAPDSRFYAVAIDKMSLGGLWHTVPVGHLLPFVCTFQGKPKDAAPAVETMRSPPKKRPVKEEEPTDDDIDESLNAALADEKKKNEDEVDESMNAALSDEKKKGESAALAESKSADEATDSKRIADQKALSVAASESSQDESSDETLDASEIAMRKEVGQAAAVMMSQEMAAQSENFDQYTEEDLLAAAATIMGGYSLNLNWAERSTRTSSSFDSQMDERMFSLALTIAEQMVLAMERRRESRRESNDYSSDQMAMAMAEVMEMNETAKRASERESKDDDEESASISVEQKANAEEKKEKKAEEKKEKKKEEITTTTTKEPTTTTEDDIDDSLNAALADQKKSSTTVAPTTNKADLSEVLTTSPPGAQVVGAVRPERKKSVGGCPAEWTQFTANSTAASLCFRRFDKPMNFEDARLFCSAKGGHLASIHNERQLLLLSALLHNNIPDTISNQTWIGLNRIHQKYYVYEDETPMDFTRWLPGAPNINDCTVFTGNELPNYPHKGTQYKFGDFPCERTQKSVLCEVSLGNDKEPTEPTCQEGWSYYSDDGTIQNGKCYKRIDESNKFHGAREVCRAENSYVASVHNEGESRFVSALLQTAKNFTINEQTWIGYVKYGSGYGWEDGSEGLAFDPWTEKLPRDKQCTVFTGNEIHEDCRSMFRFVSVDCDKSQRAVLCSKPPMNDGVPFVFKETENTSKAV